MKVVLILVDGMRPDALRGIEKAERFASQATACMTAQTTFPSVTLPCHMSLFHSVNADRHGIITNTYVPMARPIVGLVETLARAKKRCVFFYNWEELRDLAAPGYLRQSFFVSGDALGYEEANRQVKNAALSCLADSAPDFAFVYLGWSDAAGHSYGWMSDEYLRAVRGSWNCIEEIAAAVGDEYCVVVTADHGGHGRNHGLDIPEDMTIPILFKGAPFAAGRSVEGLTILDIAPTVASLLGVEIPKDWEGKSLL